MPESHTPQAGRDWAGAAGCAVLIVLGAAAFMAAREFSDLGAVFPRTIGALLVVFGGVWLVLFAMGRTRAQAALEGSSWRRAGVAITMLGWAFALPPLGFLPASAAACGALLLIARHGRWTLSALLVQGLATGALLIGLYVLFQHVLRVPLP
ncbi:tripartite tricarboxylate transporter TctB family protein [Rubrivivax albus]|uniref:Tripartite tricarboxylate transporter TctB family protein n=1 Tax=Rubrivivax albus TaxID=2499835 RepID=A0A3S2TSQ9_9BURK|nr:tripartite tricarboxylate transporter TctB family protein [Rubrivivax albus]RVT53814.1 tripartite tricarboxylate transporter TctB family protein [Rubrivivax albus]